MNSTIEQIRLGSKAALFSLLNLTFLPGFAFIWLWLNKSQQEGVALHHFNFAIKLNATAAIALFLVSWLMFLLGGFNSPWTWVYVISYFTLVHSFFIMIAVWAMVKAWSGQKVKI